MCGIAGILRTWHAGEAPPHREAIPESWLDVLDESIRHRGPDGCGRFRDRAACENGTTVDVALVHRRLAIIDPADGQQPMVHDGHRLRRDLTYQPGDSPRVASELEPGARCIAVVFNGCIYNHRDMRSQLQAAGHAFHTDHSDTEVLLHGWRQWQGAMCRQLDAMYALAIWDATSGELSLARDLFGEKPLYTHDGGTGTLCFSSVPAALIKLGHKADLPLTLDRDAIMEWIAMGYAPTGTPIRELKQLSAGTLVSSSGVIESNPASALDHRGRVSRGVHGFLSVDRGLTQAQSAVESAIDHAVVNRLEADVPIACFLSGGLDSSLIARSAKQHLGELHTLCVRMPSVDYDESPIAARVAEIIGSDHTEIDASPNPAEDVLHLIAQLGLPFGDSSVLPTHWVSSAAAGVVGVAIGGDGGDELFLGYERYSVAGDLVPIQAVAMLSLGFSPLLMPRSHPKSDFDKVARLLTAARLRSYRSLLAIHQQPDLKSLVPGVSNRRLWQDRANNVRLAQRYDLGNHLPGDLLRKVDTASMACALEVRAPMLDRALAELTLHMSVERLRSGTRTLLTSHGQRKGLLRQVARKYLPADIVDRPKHGFAIPIGEWFRSDYGGMRQLLHEHLESDEPFPGLADAGVELNMDFIRRMLREHDAAGEKSINPWHGRDHSQRLYMLLVLSIWSKWLAGLRGSTQRSFN